MAYMRDSGSGPVRWTFCRPPLCRIWDGPWLSRLGARGSSKASRASASTSSILTASSPDPAAALAGSTAGNTKIEPPLVTFAEHGARFVAAVENGPLVATQFHPKKSGDAGAQLLTNWLGTL